MPLLARTVSTPVAVHIRAGAVSQLEPLLADGRISAGGDVAIAVGPGQGESLAEELRASMPNASTFQLSGGSLESAHELIAALRGQFHDALVGIGGGKTLDVAKYAASMLGLPFVAVATNLSNDGLASPVASLDAHGRKASFGVHIPIAVIVDLNLVRESPARHTRSGIGDVVSNVSAIADWQLAAEQRGEVVDGLAVTFARSAAEALLNRTEPLDSDPLLTTLAEALFLSGMAMSVAGNSRPCSGGCHEIGHAIDALFPDAGLHGEVVAVGAMFASFLRDDAALPHIDRCFRHFEVPRLPADLGLSTGQFVDAVVAAPGTRPDRFTILEHLAMEPDEIRRKVDAFVEAFDR
ncbi:MAG TPA: iron-containing alcohol dehydrogenase family protein [Egibacteraceae bacterium]|nr:iron-containing alcohol dehydrogenase family protein [Egibacteraceae bacterium]